MPADYYPLNKSSESVGGLWLVILFILVPLGFLIPGFLAQDWDCFKDDSVCGFETGGRYDITLYTWVTDYVLGVQFLLMAIFTPTNHPMFIPFFFGFLLEGLSWTAGGIPHMMLWNESANAMEWDKYCWPIALATSGLAEICVFGAMLLAFKKCSCLCAGPMILLLGGGYGALLYMSLTDQIALKDWATDGIAQVSMSLLQFIVSSLYLGATFPSRCPFSFVYILCVAGTFAVNQLKIEPFKSNEKFNDNALFHLGAMITGAAIFQLARVIQMAKVKESADSIELSQPAVNDDPALTTQMVAEEQLKVVQEPPPRGLFACCGRRVGGWPVSNMQK